MDDGSCSIHYVVSSLTSVIIFLSCWLVGNYFEPDNTTRNISEAAILTVIAHTAVIMISVNYFLLKHLTNRIKLLLGNKSDKLTKQK